MKMNDLLKRLALAVAIGVAGVSLGACEDDAADNFEDAGDEIGDGMEDLGDEVEDTFD